MNMDVIWTQIRNILVVVGGLLVGAGLTTNVEVSKFVDSIGSVIVGIGSLIYVGTTAWQWWIRWNTRAVPITTAQRVDVPTVNPATGTVEPGKKVVS